MKALLCGCTEHVVTWPLVVQDALAVLGSISMAIVIGWIMVRLSR